MINIKKLNQLIADKYISVQKHPNCDLWIYNYTEKCQYERMWTEETIMCRGLILDKDYKIIARPFRKFWNYEEHIGEDSKLLPIPVEEFEVTEKLDGSLGIMYQVDGSTFLATRGSFISDQAKWGTEILNTKYLGWVLPFPMWEYTYLFEIIHPQNRIVVDYGDKKDLILLTIIHTETGEEIPLSNLREIRDNYMGKADFPPIVDSYEPTFDIPNLKLKQQDNKEGFVIKFKSGLRVKIKFDEYVRLHRILTGINAKTIWDLLRHNQSFDELLTHVPDEFYRWVEDTKNRLVKQYKEIEMQAVKDLFVINEDLEITFGAGDGKEDMSVTHRREFAQKAQKMKYPHILFSMLDNKPYADKIWKMIRPKAEKPFVQEV